MTTLLYTSMAIAACAGAPCRTVELHESRRGGGVSDEDVECGDGNTGTFIMLQTSVRSLEKDAEDMGAPGEAGVEAESRLLIKAVARESPSVLGVAGGKNIDQKSRNAVEHARTPAPTPVGKRFYGQGFDGLTGNFHMFIAQQIEHVYLTTQKSGQRLWHDLVGHRGSEMSWNTAVFVGIVIGAFATIVMTYIYRSLTFRGREFNVPELSSPATGPQPTLGISASGTIDAKLLSSTSKSKPTAPSLSYSTLWSSLVPLTAFSRKLPTFPPPADADSVSKKLPEPGPPACGRRSIVSDEAATVDYVEASRRPSVQQHSPVGSLNAASNFLGAVEEDIVEADASMPSVTVVTENEEDVGVLSGAQPFESPPSLCDYTPNSSRVIWEFVAPDSPSSTFRSDRDGVFTPYLVPPAEDCSVAASVVRASFTASVPPSTTDCTVASKVSQKSSEDAASSPETKDCTIVSAVLRSSLEAAALSPRTEDRAVASVILQSSLQAAASSPRTENRAVALAMLQSSFQAATSSPRAENSVTASAVLRESLRAVAFSPRTQDRAVASAVLQANYQAAALSPRTDVRAVTSTVLRSSLRAASLSPRMKDRAVEDRAVAAAVVRTSLQAAAVSPRTADRDLAAAVLRTNFVAAARSPQMARERAATEPPLRGKENAEDTGTPRSRKTMKAVPSLKGFAEMNPKVSVGSSTVGKRKASPRCTQT
eukprot:TRINITY_DN6927_c1_g2_i1.p1 TRINITY_DN6927_c1_g2~~TRINITY_DN6927_c1_g2_i1.p1  ORF type:complete len:709 (+),score=130.18 TRINITY_DN6927_c1_g2_i1:64-2190(+)